MTRISIVSISFLVLLSAANVYRAATRDVTPSEAWNYDRYIGPEWPKSLSHYDLNNHVLNSFLAKISTGRLRLTELSLRIPSLLCGLLYLWAVWRICRRMFGEGVLFLLALGLLTLHPWIFDALSEARGYGMALAFLLWGIELGSGLCLALSVTACLPFVVPALSGVGLRPAQARKLFLPFLVFLFVFLAIPLNRVLLTDLAQGARHFPWWTLLVLLPLLRPPLRIFAKTGIISLLILVATHWLIKAPYPERGAIYFIPLLTLSILPLLRRFAIPAAAICLLIYVAQLRPAYIDGRQYAGSRELAKAIRADAKQRPIRIATPPDLEPLLNYYRWRYRQWNWDRIREKGPEQGADYTIHTERGYLQVFRHDGALIFGRF